MSGLFEAGCRARGRGANQRFHLKLPPESLPGRQGMGAYRILPEILRYDPGCPGHRPCPIRCAFTRNQGQETHVTRDYSRSNA